MIMEISSTINLKMIPFLKNQSQYNIKHLQRSLVPYKVPCVVRSIRSQGLNHLNQEDGKNVCLMFTIMKEEAPNQLINLIPKFEETIRTRNNRIPVYHCHRETFKHSFFPSNLKDWFSFDDSIRNSETISTFKKQIIITYSSRSEQCIQYL